MVEGYGVLVVGGEGVKCYVVVGTAKLGRMVHDCSSPSHGGIRELHPSLCVQVETL